MRTTTNKPNTYRVYWNKPKHLTDPTTDVIFIAVLVGAAILAGYMHP